MFSKIKLLAEKNNVSMYQLSKATGISAGNITNWKNGDSRPGTRALQKIADYFHVPVSFFYQSESPAGSENTLVNEVAEVGPVICDITKEEIRKFEKIWDKLTAQDRREILEFAGFLAFKNNIVVE